MEMRKTGNTYESDGKNIYLRLVDSDSATQPYQRITDRGNPVKTTCLKCESLKYAFTPSPLLSYSHTPFRHPEW